jgi:transposase
MAIRLLLRMNTPVLPQLNETEREVMEQLLAGGTLDHKQATRLQVVLGRANRKPTAEIAEILRIHPVSVSVIVRKFNERGVEGLLKQPNHKPGKVAVSQAVINQVLKLVQTEQPENATHWSTREIAKKVGISHTKVHQILQAHDLKPHLVKRFRSSNDPAFEQKLEDIVGLYLNPPDNALVLCIDEKSQVQALERAQPILPLRPGIPERQTHDYLRHGVTNLYAALNVASGKVIGALAERHRHQEYIAFLDLVDRRTSKKKVLHVIVDNSSSHDTKEVREFLQDRPGRFVMHFTPTHSSWLNLVERWFSEITTKRIRRGSWESVKELERAIMAYVHHWNESGRRFVWAKNSEEILTKVRKAVRN